MRPGEVIWGSVRAQWGARQGTNGGYAVDGIIGLIMEGKNGSFWPGVRPYLGTVVGVGIFGLPVAVGRVGLLPGLVVLAGVGALNAVMLGMYAELLVARRNHDRFAAVIGRELGVAGELAGTAILLAVLWGAMVAYLAAGGGFVSTVAGALGWQLAPAVATVPMWALASLLAFGGLGVVTTAQKYLVPLVFAAIVAFALYAAPHMTLHGGSGAISAPWWTLVPVALFGFSGISAIAEMRDVLKGHGRQLGWAIGVGTAAVWLMYALFVASSVSGAQIGVLGAVFGMVTTFTAFVSVATAILDTLFYDFRLTHLRAWALAVTVPFLIFFLGARSLMPILQIVGGVFGGLLGIFVIIAYEKARFSGDLPKNALGIPSWLAFVVFLLFLTAFISAILGL